MKRSITLLLTIVICFSLVACGDTDASTETSSIESQENSKNESTEIKDNSSDETKIELSQSLIFAGYNIFYASDANKSSSDYGSLIGNDKYLLIVEAPSTAGIIINTENLSEAPELCEQYIFETLEHKIRSLFDFDNTTQITIKSEEVTYNDVNMLLVDGEFTNSVSNKKIPYSAIYFLAGDSKNIPVYIVGVPMTDDENVSLIIKEMAKKISK